jgi:competence protein ComFA
MPKCERCLNTDLKYFVRINGVWVCRRCMAYQGEEAEVIPNEVYVEIDLPFKLTPFQQDIAAQCKTLSKTSDILIHAVCGAGKTELVMETIKDRLNHKEKVAVAVARKQVALQLAQRFKDAFPQIKVIVVCEGHTQDLSGQLVITTTHQLYRFRSTFDCLILDEPDAFPYRNDPVLHGFMRQSVKGHIIYLTATPDKSLLKQVRQGKLKLLSLNRRPHGHPLAIPELIYSPFWVQVIIMKVILLRSEKSWIIFVPSLKTGRLLGKLLGLPFVHASSEELENLIQGFKTKRIRHILTTTVLERGVTFSDINVAILKSDHPVFDLAVLTQIAGRAGRDPKYPRGEVKLLCLRSTSALRNCRRDLRKANRSVSIASAI